MLNINILDLDLLIDTNTLYIVSLFGYNKGINKIGSSNNIFCFLFDPFNKLSSRSI